MRQLLVGSLTALMLTGCWFRGETSPTRETVAPPPPEVGEFTLDEIGLRGCGMVLWKPERSPQGPYVFFNGIEDGTMRMLINGQIVEFSRTESSGDAFYGQTTTQTFQSADGTMTATVEVTLGAEGEIENVAIDEGTIQVKQNDANVSVPVVGDAGC